MGCGSVRSRVCGEGRKMAAGGAFFAMAVDRSLLCCPWVGMSASGGIKWTGCRVFCPTLGRSAVVEGGKCDWMCFEAVVVDFVLLRSSSVFDGGGRVDGKRFVWCGCGLVWMLFVLFVSNRPMLSSLSCSCSIPSCRWTRQSTGSGGMSVGALGKTETGGRGGQE